MALTTVDISGADRNATADRPRPLVAAAALLAVTAAIHATVVPDHLREWLPAGVFFLVLAAGQASLAVALVRRAGPITLLASIWSSVAVVAVYVWSRTTGLPFAPVHGGEHGLGGSQAGHAVGGYGNGVPIYPSAAAPSTVEPVGALDLTALVAELSVIALLVCLLPPQHRRWTSNAVMVCGLTMLALRATGALS